MQQVEACRAGDDFDHGGPGLLLDAAVFAGAGTLPERRQYGRGPAFPQDRGCPTADAGVGIALKQFVQAGEQMGLLRFVQLVAVAYGVTECGPPG